jgi:hypothetical protein
MRKITEFDYAYISGYIDGDGCFYIAEERSRKRLKTKPVTAIIISSVNQHVLETFEDLYGGSVGKSKSAYENRKDLYHFTLKKKCSIKLAQHMLPYLVEKKDECLLALEFASSEDREHQLACISRMKVLKDVSNLVSKHHVIEFEKYKNTIEPSELDFAYLAGFIDAECSLNIQKYLPKDKPNYVYKILLQCNNTKAPCFKWLLERFGGHIHFIDRRNHGKARRNQLTWRLSGKALSKILDKIHPFLKHKKPVCKELIDFYATTLINGGARHTETFRSRYAEIIEERERIVAHVHKLNLKGTNNI